MAWGLAAAFMVLATPRAGAELRSPDRLEYIGSARIASNDFIGDGKDRWRTGSYRLSFGFTPPASGPGVGYIRMIEFRLGAEVIAPEKLSRPHEADRRYAGILNVGVRAHGTVGRRIYLTSGLEIYVVGPQTNLYRVHEAIHNAFGMAYSERAAELQIDDATYLATNHEAAWTVQLGPLVARPFIEAHLGMETYLRGGVDLISGGWDVSRFVTRDMTTGHLMPFGQNQQRITYVAGIDWAHVAESDLLEHQVRRDRLRRRLGVHVHNEGSKLFVGMAYLGPEGINQRGGQRVGSVSITFAF
ncbi:lipid A-modifier LpxR family protein [Halodurantibacterium flavum]|uniref:Lipid A-modifier LpxR family protein n=1 Tax=Halodurantibacterium flavum TaxID=1382802 RepID=A0ABW4S220_9RHOB